MLRLPVAALLAAALALPVAAGPVLVTVTGDVSEPNRGPVDPEYDKLFVFNEVKFDKAHEFDLDTLKKLPQATVHADFPKGGAATALPARCSRTCSPPRADGQTVTVQAMDGYAVEVPLADMVAKGAVLALERDGRPLGIGNFGPTQIVFPRADRPELADMPDDWSIWQNLPHRRAVGREREAFAFRCRRRRLRPRCPLRADRASAHRRGAPARRSVRRRRGGDERRLARVDDDILPYARQGEIARELVLRSIPRLDGETTSTTTTGSLV